MHRTIVIGLLCMACTRDNPAFDEQLSAAEGTGDPGDGDGDGDQGDGDGDDASTTLDERDMPSDCALQPHDGLSIQVGRSSDFGGQCGANGVIIWMKIIAVQGGVVEAEVCPEGCAPCGGSMLSFSLSPIDVSTYIPAEVGKCMALEAGGPRGGDDNGCYWGALTIYDSAAMVPYVIATTHSFEPTPAGIEMLAGVIPTPEKAEVCDCDAIGQSNECCYGADAPPEFLQYPFESGPVLPGGSTELPLANSAGVAHVFKLLQAQHIHSCESPDVELSWAVLAQM